MRAELEKLLSDTQTQHIHANEQITKWAEARLRTEGALMVLNHLKAAIGPLQEGGAESQGALNAT